MNADIIRMAREAGIAHHGLGWTCWEGQLERFYNLVRADEREACARVCDEFAQQDRTGYGVAEDCAVAIRARGGE